MHSSEASPDQETVPCLSTTAHARSQSTISFLAFMVASFLAHMALSQFSFAAPPTHQAHKILFVGDSFTGSQGGIQNHLLRMSQSNPATAAVVTDVVWVGGATLKRLWELGDSVRRIDTGSFDTIVLQDDIPEINIDYFRQYAQMFVEEARRHHARPVLYMTWAYKRLGWISMAQIAEAHRAISKELAVEVAPVGLAWDRAEKLRPELDLLVEDREHPSPSGMYLATCVVYATIFDINPVGLPYIPAGVAPSDATFLQEVAWQTVISWRKEQNLPGAGTTQ